MHCKKVRLAVEAALADHPSPLDGINHKWVAGGWQPMTFLQSMNFDLSSDLLTSIILTFDLSSDIRTVTSIADWLRGIGLPQYQRMFLDGRIDGRMLNSISKVFCSVDCCGAQIMM